MPRYRLFGETAKFAALLNSTGEGRNLCPTISNHIWSINSPAMKIHISLETKILLDSIGGYILEPRGLIMVDVSRCPQKPHYKDFSPGTWPEGDLLAYRWDISIQSSKMFLHGRDYNQCIKEGKMARSLLMAVTTSARWKNGFPYIVKRAENTSRSRALTTCVGCQATLIWTTSL